MHNKKLPLVISMVLVLTALVAVGEVETIVFGYGDTITEAPKIGRRVELFPVLRLIGAEASFSPAAGTYGIVHGDHIIQFATERRSVLVDGVLREAGEAPVVSPGGVAASISYLDREILSPLGLHLEAVGSGYRIMPGGRFADPVKVRPVAADFAATTTLVLTLDRETEVEVTSSKGSLVVHFPDGSPQVDRTLPFRSHRVRLVRSNGQDLDVVLDGGVGLLSWHRLPNPSRVILELGLVRPTPTPAPVVISENQGRPPIVIDPGHGGDDTGAVGADGLMEKDLVLAIARLVARTLEDQGHVVRLTRNGDDVRALSDRTALANRLEAQVFVSLHANASTIASVRGAETYYMSLDKSATDEAAAATASLENQVGSAPKERSSLDLILWDLAQSDVLNESSELALRIQGRLNAQLGLKDRGVKQAPFVVLTGATMPAALVEVGFLSNPSEAKRLRNPSHQKRIADAVALGVLDYVNRR